MNCLLLIDLLYHTNFVQRGCVFGKGIRGLLFFAIRTFIIEEDSGLKPHYPKQTSFLCRFCISYLKFDELLFYTLRHLADQKRLSQAYPQDTSLRTFQTGASYLVSREKYQGARVQ